MIKQISLGILMVLCFALPAMSAIDVFDFETPQQEKQFRELSHTLRCPKCQNNSIADSNAELAKDLRTKVYQMTKEGKSKEEIVDYMVARYGNFVTYNPPLTLSTAILWLAPFVIIVCGFGFIVLKSRARTKVAAVAAEQQWDEEKEARLKQLLTEAEQQDNTASSQTNKDNNA